MFKEFTTKRLQSEVNDLFFSSDGNSPIIIDDPHLIFSGHYERQGFDLLISDFSGAKAYISNYFSGDQPPDIKLPGGGAFLDGQTVNLLAGPDFAAHFAQSISTSGIGNPIGSVETISGDANVTRTDGSIESLQIGTLIYQGDVIATGDNGNLGITFVDETVFTLSPESRMVMNELVFDPGSDNNSMVANLVEGAFVFVTGQVAGSQDVDGEPAMQINTPVATMGIRGTTVGTVVSSDGTSDFTLFPDPGPDGKVGSFQIIDRLTNEVIGVIDTVDLGLKVRPVSDGVETTQIEGDDAGILKILAQAAYDNWAAAQESQSFLDLRGPGSEGDPDTGNGNGGEPKPPEQQEPDPNADPDPGPGDRTDSDLEKLFEDLPEDILKELLDELREIERLAREGLLDPPQGRDRPEDDFFFGHTDVFANDLFFSAFEDGNIVSARATSDATGNAEYRLIAEPQVGSLSFKENGDFEFDPGDGAFDDLAVGEFRDVTFTYVVIDQFGNLSNEATVTITVEGTNDPVETVSPLARTTTENGSSLSGSFKFSDADISDVGHTTSITLQKLGDTAGLVAADEKLLSLFSTMVSKTDQSTEGTINWGFDGSSDYFDYLANGETLILKYIVAITDGNGSTAFSNVQFNITGTNDAPTVEVVNSILSASEDAPVLANFFYFEDVDLSDVGHTTSVALTKSGDASGLTATDAELADLFSTVVTKDAMSTQGRVDWEFNGSSSVFDYLADGETLTLKYAIQVTDPHGLSAFSNVEINITGNNDAPIVKQVNDVSDSFETFGRPMIGGGSFVIEDVDLTDTVSLVGITASASSVFDAPLPSQSAMLSYFNVFPGLGTSAENSLTTSVALPASTEFIDNASTTGTVSWSFFAYSDAIDVYPGDTMTITYTITLEDQTGTRVNQDVTIELTYGGEGGTGLAAASRFASNEFEGVLDTIDDGVYSSQMAMIQTMQHLEETVDMPTLG